MANGNRPIARKTLARIAVAAKVYFASSQPMGAVGRGGGSGSISEELSLADVLLLMRMTCVDGIGKMKQAAIGTTLLVASAFAAPLSASEFSERYDSTGTVTASVNGEALNLQSWFDKQRTRSSNSAEEHMFGDVFYNIVAATVGENGRPANPMVQISFIMRADGSVLPVDLWLIDADFMRPLAAGDNGGPMSMSGVASDGTSLSGEFEGRLVRYDQSTGQLDTTEPEVEISGSFSVLLPER